MVEGREAEEGEKEREEEEVVVKEEGVKEEDIIVIAIKVLGEDHLIIREQEEVTMATRELGVVMELRELRVLVVVMVLQEPKVEVDIVTKVHLGVTRVSPSSNSNTANRLKAVREDMTIIKT